MDQVGRVPEGGVLGVSSQWMLSTRKGTRNIPAGHESSTGINPLGSSSGKTSTGPYAASSTARALLSDRAHSTQAKAASSRVR